MDNQWNYKLAESRHAQENAAPVLPEERNKTIIMQAL